MRGGKIRGSVSGELDDQVVAAADIGVHSVLAVGSRVSDRELAGGHFEERQVDLDEFGGINDGVRWRRRTGGLEQLSESTIGGEVRCSGTGLELEAADQPFEIRTAQEIPGTVGNERGLASGLPKAQRNENGGELAFAHDEGIGGHEVSLLRAAAMMEIERRGHEAGAGTRIATRTGGNG